MIDQLKYRIEIQWSDVDHCYLVGFPDFPEQRWRTHGDTYQTAFANALDCLESLVEAYQTVGHALPEPNRVVSEAWSTGEQWVAGRQSMVC
jgi:predicted RNase H-like HicB family nuclease